MNYYYYVFSIKKNGLRYAYAERLPECSNLRAFFCDNIEAMQPCKTMKKAIELADYWNASYKANNNYLYDYI